MAASSEPELSLPSYSADELATLVQGQGRVRGFLLRLTQAPPQVILLEGGLAGERLGLAMLFALACNCEGTGDRPCLACASCSRMLSGAHRDLYLFDGSQGSIKIGRDTRDEGTIRWLRPVLGDPPREGNRRVVILHEAQALGIEAANALLKSLEEPRPATTFFLMAPQRERLLPTLVSRGWTLTLNWPDTLHAPPDPGEDSERAKEWVDALTEFLRTGKDWMAKTSSKKAVDPPLASALILACQRAVAQTLSGRADFNLAIYLASSCDVATLRRIEVLLGECVEALGYGVNPALVVDRLATSLYAWQQDR
ncbi:MAG: DNA polymerase III subunit delta' [Desulfovibrio sp.]|nr:MAG: DNA polymerase III subunit delta' [Desulfovibrio sp.]